jgi:hypothetical protein
MIFTTSRPVTFGILLSRHKHGIPGRTGLEFLSSIKVIERLFAIAHHRYLVGEMVSRECVQRKFNIQRIVFGQENVLPACPFICHERIL